MKKNKLLFILILIFIIPNLGVSQFNIITQGFTSGGGSAKTSQSFDFAFGQIFSNPITSENIKGNEGILQVISSKSVGISETDLTDIKVFPNPTFGLIKIQKSCEGTYNLKMIDSKGQLLLSKKQINCDHTINVDHLLSGLYFLIIQQDNKAKTFKINKI